jgi:hypothetical protein
MSATPVSVDTSLGILAADASNTLDESASHSDLRLVWNAPANPSPGAFFRHVTGTDFVSLDQRGKVYLLDLGTGEKLAGPGFIDFVPTPDGTLFVTPGKNRTGLEFFAASSVFANVDMSDSLHPAYRDRRMTDQYPSIGVLTAENAGYDQTYRVLTSWSVGLMYRDYGIRRAADNSTHVLPLSGPTAVCPEKWLSTSMLSRDGREFAARDEATGTTKIFLLAHHTDCEEVIDLGLQTSKVAFRNDGRFIAFSALSLLEDAQYMYVTYVLDRQNQGVARVRGSESRTLSIPEFVGADSLLVLVNDGKSEFRLFCCIK